MSEFKIGDIVECIQSVSPCVCGEKYVVADVDDGFVRTSVSSAWIISGCFRLVADSVSHPPHYTAGNIECWDALRAMLGDEGFIAFCRGTVVKYLWRAGKKENEVEDYRKAKAYLEKLLSVKE